MFENEDNVTFQRAPVKTYDRCLIKSNTDYSKKSYPTSACIVDLLRCSITFENSESLLNGLNKIINEINNGKIEGIKKILRIKNGFKDILNWKNFNDAQYVDVKLNVLYENEDETLQQIVEIQCLLKSLLDAKKFGLFVPNNIFYFVCLE